MSIDYNRAVTILIASCFVLLSLSTSSFSAPPQPQVVAPSIQPHELLIKLRPGISAGQKRGLERALQGGSMRAFRQPPGLARGRMDRWRHVTLPDAIDIKKMTERLRRNPAVELVEPNYIVTTNVVPNDPDFTQLWGLNNTGQTGGAADADIDAPEAWDIQTGADSGVIVAVNDTGVDYNHDDLKDSMWINPGEIAGNGIDDDGNGYVDDVHGYDFYNDDGDPFDDHGHGTHVAGTIAASANNGIGITGVSWGAKIMAVKFFNSQGQGTVAGAIDSVLYATSMGARIMNNSWGGGGYSQALKDAIRTAHDANALFVAAAGNSNNDNDLNPHYPSSYDVPNVLAVAATDQSDQRAWFSSYGANSVDLGAPGVDIYSTLPSQSYDYKSGTSMATPHVVGAAAVVLAHKPQFTAEEVKGLLIDTVDPVPALASLVASGGRLNLNSALRCEESIGSAYTLSVATPRAGFNVLPGGPVSVKASARRCGAAVTGATLTATFDNNDTATTLYDDGVHGDGAANDGVYAGQWLPYTIGTVVITVTSAHPDYALQSATVTGEVIDDFTYAHTVVDFNWIDATVGTAYALSDESGVSVPIGFAFDYYGQQHEQLTIRDNGFVQFGPSTGYLTWINMPIPTSSIPNNFIAPYWDDLNPGVGGQIYTLTEGVAPNRRFTVAWVDVPHYNVGGAITFEVTLYEGSNEIVMQYLDTVFGSLPFDSGRAATIGVENADGTDGLQISFYSAGAVDGTSYRVVPVEFDGNYRPVAVPNGPQFAARNQSSSFDGSASWDRDGDTLGNYRWDFGDSGQGEGVTVEHTYTAMGNYTVSLVVSDGAADSRPGTTEITVVGETPPVANAGAGYETIYGGTIEFDGSASYDPDGDIIQTYTWDFGDGSTASGVAPAHTYGAPGNYVASLVVSDGATSSFAATASVVVHPNTAPIANPGGPYGGHWRNTYVFDGSGSSDPDGDSLLEYRWSINGQVFGYGSSYITWWNFPEGTHNLGLQVYDGYLWSEITYTTLTLTNMAPIIDSGGPYSVHWNAPVTLDASGSTDPDGDPLDQFIWYFSDDYWRYGPTVSYTFGYSGTATVKLEVSDGSATSTEIVQINLTNAAPSASIGGPYTGVWGQSVPFDSAGSIDPDGDTLQYQWDFGDGRTGSAIKPAHSYNAPGVYTVTLTVTDGDMSSTTVSTTATITNTAPVADAGGPYSVLWGRPLTLNGGGSYDPDGHGLSYSWDFGDGNTGVGVTPSHTYDTLGVYAVTLTVADKFDSATATTTVNVINAAPIAKPGGPYTVAWNKSLFFDGSLSSDPDGDSIVSYNWNFGDGATGTGSQLWHKYTAPGTYTVTLVVSDKFTASEPATVTVEVTNQTPTAVIPWDPITAYRENARNFSGSGSTDPDGDSLTYHWDMGDGNSVTSDSSAISYTYTQLGTYTLALTVSDGFATSAPATATVMVLNSAPIADAGPYTRNITERQTVTLDGTGSRDLDGTIVAYQWTQLAGKKVRLQGADTAVATFTAPNVSYERVIFELTVTDNDGATAKDIAEIIIQTR